MHINIDELKAELVKMVDRLAKVGSEGNLAFLFDENIDNVNDDGDIEESGAFRDLEINDEMIHTAYGVTDAIEQLLETLGAGDPETILLVGGALISRAAAAATKPKSVGDAANDDEVQEAAEDFITRIMRLSLAGVILGTIALERDSVELDDENDDDYEFELSDDREYSDEDDDDDETDTRLSKLKHLLDEPANDDDDDDQDSEDNSENKTLN
jgi:hypothetical protein